MNALKTIVFESNGVYIRPEFSKPRLRYVLDMLARYKEVDGAELDIHYEELSYAYFLKVNGITYAKTTAQARLILNCLIKGELPGSDVYGLVGEKGEFIVGLSHQAEPQ